jgi:hypothetical protein
VDPPPRRPFLAGEPGASRLLQTPAAIYAPLTMEDDEMRMVVELEISFLREFSNKIWFYYAQRDHWVTGQREVVLRTLRGMPA